MYITPWLEWLQDVAAMTPNIGGVLSVRYPGVLSLGQSCGGIVLYLQTNNLFAEPPQSARHTYKR